MMPKMIWPVLSSAWLSVIMWPMPRRRADQLGDDHVGPGPAEHQPQDLGDLGRSGRACSTRRMMPRSLGAQRVGGLDQVAPRVADGHRDHQDDLEDRADEDDQQLLQSRRCRPTGSAAE